MKRTLIVASVGILASTVWVVAANAQANINPNLYPNNTSERYGAQPLGGWRPDSQWQSVPNGGRPHAWLWLYEGLPSPCRQHAGAVSSCSRDPSCSRPGAKAQGGVAVIQTR